jgi:hypothetical protein
MPTIIRSSGKMNIINIETYGFSITPDGNLYETNLNYDNNYLYSIASNPYLSSSPFNLFIEDGKTIKISTAFLDTEISYDVYIIKQKISTLPPVVEADIAEEESFG